MPAARKFEPTLRRLTPAELSDRAPSREGSEGIGFGAALRRLTRAALLGMRAALWCGRLYWVLGALYDRAPSREGGEGVGIGFGAALRRLTRAALLGVRAALWCGRR